MLRETAIVLLDYVVRFSLILFFPLLIADFCVIDRLLRLEYFHAKKAWNDEGRPHGYFWVPPESKALAGWFVSPRSSVALQRISFEWLIKSPEWMANDERARRLLWLHRLLVFVICLQMIGLCGLAALQ